MLDMVVEHFDSIAAKEEEEPPCRLVGLNNVNREEDPSFFKLF